MTLPRHLILSLSTMVALLAGCVAEEPPPAGSWMEELEAPVFHPWARFPETDPGFRSVEVGEDVLTFTFDGASPVEAMTVVAGGGGAGGEHPYLRYVDSVTTLSDGRVQAATRPAKLTNLVRSMHSIFHYRPTVREEYARTEAAGEVAGLRAASGDCEDSAPCPLVRSAKVKLNDVVGCSVSGGSAATIDPFVEPSFEADFELEIGGLGEALSCAGSTISFGLLGDCEGVIEKATLSVEGSITAGFELAVTGAAGASCAVDFFRDRPPSVVLATFSVGPVPVTIRAEPVVEAEAGFMIDAGEVTLTAQATFGARSKLGYEDGDWVNEFDPYLHPSADLETTRAGGIEASAGVKVGAKVLVLVADAAGPFIELTAGIEGTFETQTDGCEYDVSVDIDLEAKFGAKLQVPVLGLELVEVSLEPIELASWDIWSTSGTLPWCGGSMTCTGEGTCRDDVFDRDVCEGGEGFKQCPGPVLPGRAYAQRCGCGPSGWVECSSCMDFPLP